MAMQRKKKMRRQVFLIFSYLWYEILKFYELIYCTNCLILQKRGPLLIMELSVLFSCYYYYQYYYSIRSLERRMLLWLLLLTISSGNLNTPEHSEIHSAGEPIHRHQVSRFHFNTILHDAPFLPPLSLPFYTCPPSLSFPSFLFSPFAHSFLLSIHLFYK